MKSKLNNLKKIPSSLRTEFAGFDHIQVSIFKYLTSIESKTPNAATNISSDLQFIVGAMVRFSVVDKSIKLVFQVLNIVC